MKITSKENQLGYFKFFFGILRFRLLFTIGLNIVIGLLDGIGLTMLIPLLQSVDPASQGKQSTGQLGIFFSIFQFFGVPLTVNVVLIVFLLLFIVKAAIKYVALRYQTNVQLLFIKKLQFQFLAQLQKLSYEGYLQLDAGKIQNTVVSDVSRVSEAMKNYLRWSNSFFLLLTYIFLAYLANPQFAFLITVGIGLTNLLYRNLFKKIKAASYDISRKGQNLNGFLIELVHYFKYLKSTAYVSRFSSKLKDIIRQTYATESRLGRYTAIILSIKEPFAVFVVVLVMIVQINVMGSGIGSIVLSLLLFYRGLGNLMTLQTDWQNFLRLSGAFKTVSEVSEKMESFKEPSGSVVFDSLREQISLEHIHLSFGSNSVLKNVNIRIPKNTTIALTGVSGSGKTTLINIISGLLKPDQGNVLIDGKKLTEYDLESYRGKVGYISQEAVVFNDSIFNNITFWAEPTEENKRRFWEVVGLSSLTEFVNAQFAKEHTQLGDNGVLLSGGQRQRISIARELFKKPEILILDEATSALDSETERVIQTNIENLHRQYTVIIIAHRFSTIKHVDEIYFLEQGEIAHSGKFNEMIANSAKFKHLVSLQGL